MQLSSITEAQTRFSVLAAAGLFACRFAIIPIDRRARGDRLHPVRKRMPRFAKAIPPARRPLCIREYYVIRRVRTWVLALLFLFFKF